jgi:hypothetical protein
MIDSFGKISPYVKINVTGIETAQNFAFTTNTWNPFTVQTLNISCIMQYTTNTFVNSTYPIKFLVKPCNFTSLLPNPSVYTVFLNQNYGTVYYENLNLNDFIIKTFPQC